MLIENVKRLSPIQRFFYWIHERHRIHLLWQQGKPKPWTDDKVMQSYFFTNPYRENDKVTVWMREAFREPWRDLDKVWFATICFRWFTWIPTGELLLREGLLEKWDSTRAVCLLKKQNETGKVFTGAFMISNGGSTKSKVEYICEDCIQDAWNNRREYLVHWDEECTMEGMHSGLRELRGLGGFMAYEVVCDLRHTKFLEKAPDKLTWCNPGPGAKRGLNRLLYGKPEGAINKKEWAYETGVLLRLANQELHCLKKMPPFEMREIEHSLCEWDKYERALWGQGHMKRIYRGA